MIPSYVLALNLVIKRLNERWNWHVKSIVNAGTVLILKLNTWHVIIIWGVGSDSDKWHVELVIHLLAGRCICFNDYGFKQLCTDH